MAKEIKKHILSVYDENGNKIPIPAIGSKDYKLPAASENKLGGIKAPAKTPDQTVPVGIGEDNKLYVAPSGGEQVQSDWAENDPQSPAYVKNRPFYSKDPVESVFAPEQTVTLATGGRPTLINTTSAEIKPLTKYRVTINGDVYDEESYYFQGVGNAIGKGTPPTFDPFIIAANEGQVFIFSSKYSGDITISVVEIYEEPVKLPEKYLPEEILNPVGERIAEGGEIFNDYINNVASGYYSHAEGSETTASGDVSHAEGYASHAEGDNSHAEGVTSHAEGAVSHAEGDTSHAEGYASHAEGYYTEASGESQHAQGRYNLPDTEDGTTTGVPKNKYAHVVGNGNDDATRSNAHTLDWEGNSWYQGNVLVGGKDMDSPMAVLASDHIIIKASDSEDRFKITVDKTGAIKAEKVI